MGHDWPQNQAMDGEAARHGSKRAQNHALPAEAKERAEDGKAGTLEEKPWPPPNGLADTNDLEELTSRFELVWGCVMAFSLCGAVMDVCCCNFSRLLEGTNAAETK